MNIATTISQEVETISLHCTFGSSDKEYHASLVKQPCGLWQIETLNGRRGSTLVARVKPDSPVEYSVAKKEYDKLVKSKLKDNYVVMGSVAPEYQSVNDLKSFVEGHEPQLLTPITEDKVEYYLSSPLWGAQEKMDGERRQFSSWTQAGNIGTNRKGKAVPIPLSLLKSGENIFHDGTPFHIDGEIIGERLYAFDLLVCGEDIKGNAFINRFETLARWIGNTETAITLVPLAKTEDEKRTLLKSIMDANGEGIVFKRLEAPYSEDSIKYKLYADATVVVTGINLQRSVAIGVETDDGSIVNVGNVTIPTNKTIPMLGDLIDVKYLYFFTGGSLYQPTYDKPREDKDRADIYSSLKRKPA